jgi:hypothetical protein
MYLIYRLKILVLFVLASQLCHGQYIKQGRNYQDFQRKPYYFGISLGYNSSNYRLFRSKDFVSNDTFNIAEGVEGPGFNVGVVTNLKLGEYFDFRFLPSFSFAERNIFYSRAVDSRNSFERTVESVFFEAPFQIRYKSAPYKDMRLFLITGFKYSFDIQSKSRTKKNLELLRLSAHDYAVEIGAGIQFFMPYFIFSPEIKYSHGLNNILIHNADRLESSILEKLISRTFTISLHFEG